MSVAEVTGLNLAPLETPKAGLSRRGPFELRHEKTNNVDVRQDNTRIILGPSSDWSESSLS